MPTEDKSWNEGPVPPQAEPYRPNDAWARVLAAKQRLDAQTWPKRRQ